MQAAGAIQSLEHPDERAFRTLAAAGRPFLIERAAAHWPALAKWTPDYLEERAGSVQVPVLVTTEDNAVGRFFYGGNSAAMVEFRECLPLLRGAPPRVYMAGVPVAAYLPALAEDLRPLSFVPPDRQRRCQLWISGTNSKGPLHFDLDDNIHLLVSGRKRFFLFDHDQTGSLYPCSVWSSTPHYARIDPHEPDLERFPRLRSARGREVTLRPGQSLYIPQGCWHQVITEEPSVAINYWLGKHYVSPAMLRVLPRLSVHVAAMAALLGRKLLAGALGARQQRPVPGPS